MAKNHKLIVMNYIDPSEIVKLPPDDVVMVSRIVLNNARAFSNLIPTKKNEKATTTLLIACQQLNAQDEANNRPSFGVEMRAEDVKIIFKSQLDTLPKRSFILASNSLT